MIREVAQLHLYPLRRNFLRVLVVAEWSQNQPWLGARLALFRLMLVRFKHRFGSLTG